MNNREMQYWLSLGFAEDVAAALVEKSDKRQREIDKHFKKKNSKKRRKEETWK